LAGSQEKKGDDIMFGRISYVCAAVVLIAFTASVFAGQAQYVIEISVDGLGSSYLSSLLGNGQIPSLSRIQSQGVSTLNARDDYDITVTLPNHVTMVTARPVMGTLGHNWVENSDPEEGQTLHNNKGEYVAGVFDVAHDNGLRTAMYATKSKFSLFTTSYNAVNGAADTTGVDNGRNKIDTYLCDDSQSITDSFISEMSSNLFNYSFIHYGDCDAAGHAYGWGSEEYNNALIAVDGYLRQILTLIDNSSVLRGRTAIILTVDHGGCDYDHSDPTLPLNYTIPFIVWGAGAAENEDLYALNPNSRLDPGTGHPSYDESLQPVRNGDGANLALELLGLGAIPGSSINYMQDLVIPEPASVLLLAIGGIMLRRR
jgi:predicted AlkP superfamily pyrophosphatase or phosphodiesterase